MEILKNNHTYDKLKGVSMRGISIIMSIILAISTLGLSSIQANAEDIPLGYHRYYHNNGQLSDYGDESPFEDCDNYTHIASDGKPCTHYLVIEIKTFRDDPAVVPYYDIPCIDGTSWRIRNMRIYCYYVGSTPYFTFTKPSSYVGECVIDMRLYRFEASNPNCKDQEVGYKKIKGLAYYRWMWLGDTEAGGGFGFDGCNMLHPDIGGTSYKLAGVNKYHYFAGYNLLVGEEQLNSRGQYPTFDSAINGNKSPGVQVDWYSGNIIRDSNGNPVTSSATPQGFPWKTHVHTMYRYKCEGHLQPIEYKIHYDLNGGTGGTVPDQVVKYEEEVELSGKGEVVNPGYIFKGWGYETTDEVTNIPGDKVKNLTTQHDDIVTMYAIWEPGEYTVRIHMNDPDPGRTNIQINVPDTWTRTSDGVEKKFVYGKDQLPVASSIFKDKTDVWGTREGYWSTQKPNGQCTGVYYEEGKKNVTADTSGTVINLYVSWKSLKLPLVATDNGNETVHLDWSKYTGNFSDVYKAFDSETESPKTWQSVQIDGESQRQSEIETGAVSMYEVFSTWGRIGASGNWYISNNKLINGENSDKMTGFLNLDPVAKLVSNWELSYTCNPIDGDDDIIGSIVKCNVNNGLVSGYLIASDDGGCYSGLRVYRLDNVNLAGFNLWDFGGGGSKRLLGSTSAGQWGRGNTTYDVSITEDNVITVKCNGTTVLTCKDTYANPILMGSIALVNNSQASAFSKCTWTYKRFLEVQELDVVALDKASPDTPNIIEYQDNILTLQSKDNGTPYWYQVEAYARSNLSQMLIASNVDTVTINQGLKGYRYYLDNIEQGQVNKCTLYKAKDTNEQFKFNLSTDNPNKFKYLHIIAVDNANIENKSKILTIEIPYDRIYEVTFDPQGGKIGDDRLDTYKTTVEWTFTGWNIKDCNTTCKHTTDADHFSDIDRCEQEFSCDCEEVTEPMIGDKTGWKADTDITLKTHWKDGRLTLPGECYKIGFEFIGWYSKPMTTIQLPDDTLKYGGGKDWDYEHLSMHTINKNTIIYAVYNRKPIFIDIYEGLFFEGQSVTYNDLLELVRAWDYEDNYLEMQEQNIKDYFESKINRIDQDINTDEDMEEYLVAKLDELIYERPDSSEIDDLNVQLDELRDHLHELFEEKEYIEQQEEKILESLPDRAQLLPLNIAEIDYLSNSVTFDYRDMTESGLTSNGLYTAVNNGDYDSKYLKTGTAFIGDFDITYQVHDEGISYKDMDGNIDYIPNSDVTMEYTRRCKVNFNYNPLLYTQGILIYTQDNIDDFGEYVKAQQASFDSEDTEDNIPWWSKYEASSDTTGELLHMDKNQNTIPKLQDSIVITGVQNFKFSTAFKYENEQLVEEFISQFTSKEGDDLDKYTALGKYHKKGVGDINVVDKSSLLNKIYNFKDNGEEFYNGVTKAEVYKALQGMDITFDSVDQWGKWTSNNVTSDKYNDTDDTDTTPGKVDTDRKPSGFTPENNGGYDIPEDLDDDNWDDTITQEEPERTTPIIIVNTGDDSLFADNNLLKGLIRDKIRYISNDYLSTLGLSYWGTYGLETLEEILNKEENTESKVDHSGTYETNTKDKIDVKIHDYTK